MQLTGASVYREVPLRRVYAVCVLLVVLGLAGAANAEVQVKREEAKHFVEVVAGLRSALAMASEDLTTAEQVREFRELATALFAYLQAIGLPPGGAAVSTSVFGDYLRTADPYLVRNLQIADGAWDRGEKFKGMFSVLKENDDAAIAASEAARAQLRDTALAIMGTAGFEFATADPEPPAMLGDDDMRAAVLLASMGVVRIPGWLPSDLDGERRFHTENITTLQWLFQFLANPEARKHLTELAKTSRYAEAALALVQDPSFGPSLAEMVAAIAFTYDSHGTHRVIDVTVVDAAKYGRAVQTAKGLGAVAFQRASGGSATPATVTPKIQWKAFSDAEGELVFRLVGAFIGTLPSFYDQVPWNKPHVDATKSRAYRLLGTAGFSAYALLGELRRTATTNYLSGLFQGVDVGGAKYLMSIAAESNSGFEGLLEFRQFHQAKDREALQRVVRSLSDRLPRKAFDPATVAWSERVAVTDLQRTQPLALSVVATSFAVLAHRLRAGVSVRETQLAARQIALLIQALDMLEARRDEFLNVADAASRQSFVGQEDLLRSLALVKNYKNVRAGLVRLHKSFELHSRSVLTAAYEQPEFGVVEGVGILSALVDTGVFDPASGCSGSLNWAE